MGKRKVVPAKDSSDNDDNMPRSAANARERTRMRVLSKSFERLKLMLPWVPADTKLSKLDTLRLAMTYINHLHNMVVESDAENMTETVPCHSSERLTSVNNKRSWPYSHHQSLQSSRIPVTKYEDNNNAVPRMSESLVAVSSSLDARNESRSYVEMDKCELKVSSMTI